MDIDAPGAVMHGVGIVFFRGAGRKAAYALRRKHSTAQHADKVLVAHIEHAFIIRSRQGQQWYVLGAHARTIHAEARFVKGFLRPGTLRCAAQAQLPAGGVDIMPLLVTHGDGNPLCHKSAAEGLAISL